MESNFDDTAMPTEEDKENEVDYPITEPEYPQSPYHSSIPTATASVPVGHYPPPPQPPPPPYGHYGYNQSAPPPPHVLPHSPYIYPVPPHVASSHQAHQATGSSTDMSPPHEASQPSGAASTVSPSVLSNFADPPPASHPSHHAQQPGDALHPHPQLPPPHPYYPIHPPHWPYHPNPASPYQPHHPPIYPGGHHGAPFPPHVGSPPMYPHGQPYINHYDGSTQQLQQQPSSSSYGTSPGTSDGKYSSMASTSGDQSSPHVSRHDLRSAESTPTNLGFKGNNSRLVGDPPEENHHDQQHSSVSDSRRVRHGQHNVPQKRFKRSASPSSSVDVVATFQRGGTALASSTNQGQEVASEVTMKNTGYHYPSASSPSPQHPHLHQSQVMMVDARSSLNINSFQPSSIQVQVSNMSIHSNLPPIPPSSNNENDSKMSHTVRERRARKNHNSRIRAARLKERIADIEKKDPSERTEEESDTLELYEERRERKNKRSRELAIEKKQKMDQIMLKPESEWTHAEKRFIEETMTAKYRKNLGDRVRRKRIKEDKEPEEESTAT